MAFGLDDAIGAGIGIFGNLLSGQMNANASMERQDSANAFSAQQYATRYQTTVKDMEAAGLNPMLAYSQGAGSAPSGATVNATPYGNLGDAANAGRMSSAQVANIQADTVNKSAQTANIEADTMLKRAQTFLSTAQEGLAGASADQARSNVSYLEAQAKKISLELNNIPKEGDRLDGLVRNLGAEFENIKSRTHNVDEATKQIKWLAVKTMLESDLVGLDVKAAQSLDNIGRYGKELKPAIDIIRGLLRK